VCVDRHKRACVLVDGLVLLTARQIEEWKGREGNGREWNRMESNRREGTGRESNVIEWNRMEGKGGTRNCPIKPLFAYG
jgi:hypothetical protein